MEDHTEKLCIAVKSRFGKSCGITERIDKDRGKEAEQQAQEILAHPKGAHRGKPRAEKGGKALLHRYSPSVSSQMKAEVGI